MYSFVPQNQVNVSANFQVLNRVEETRNLIHEPIKSRPRAQRKHMHTRIEGQKGGTARAYRVYLRGLKLIIDGLRNFVSYTFVSMTSRDMDSINFLYV